MRLLLHICCAPCAVAIVDKLKNQAELSLEGFFYNPNIHPIQEYTLRKASVEDMAQGFNLPLLTKNEDGMALWKEKLNGDKALRCNTCYALRLDETARLAKEKGFEAFTTSLLISPYQDHDLIRTLGEKMAQKYQLKFYYEDFRELYRKGREMSRGKYYMQKFCGCMYSYAESDHPKKPIYLLD
jgi:predicted adenine nucleotide alpha hydrolase (AANH) superfamily ATPase